MARLITESGSHINLVPIWGCFREMSEAGRDFVDKVLNDLYLCEDTGRKEAYILVDGNLLGLDMFDLVRFLKLAVAVMTLKLFHEVNES